jgi:hypothetical protein
MASFHGTMRGPSVRMCCTCPLAAGLSVRREPKCLSRIDYDSTTGGIQHTTRALNLTAPMADGGWRGLIRAKKEGRSLKAGVCAVEKEQGRRENPGGGEARAKR